jgi:hypothetical protein
MIVNNTTPTLADDDDERERLLGETLGGAMNGGPGKLKKKCVRRTCIELAIGTLQSP